MNQKPEIQFIDDWTPLREAVAWMHEEWYDEEIDTHSEVYNSTQARHAVDAVASLVPRLIKAYEELWDSSVKLTTAWEAYMRHATPAGLLVPKMGLEAL